MLGVAEEELVNTDGRGIRILGTQFALVVHSNGLDEISASGVTKICELKNGQITEKEMNPDGFRNEILRA